MKVVVRTYMFNHSVYFSDSDIAEYIWKRWCKCKSFKLYPRLDFYRWQVETFPGGASLIIEID